MTPDHATRHTHDARTAALVGRRLLGVDYWDVHDFSGQPRGWDHGDWHEAVMGLDLRTEQGTNGVTWTNTFFAHGVEVLPTPLAAFLGPNDDSGPQSWNVDASPPWRDRIGTPITAARTHWEPISVGPAVRQGVEIAPAHTVEVPFALRLDFASGPAWFVAATAPRRPNRGFFLGGDELIVTFTPAPLLAMGFDESAFTAPEN